MATPVQITYASLASPGEDIHRGYERGLENVRGALGQVHPLLIGGKRRESPRTFPDTNPADTRQVLGHFALGGPQDVADAVTAAQHAFTEWSRVPWRGGGALRRRGGGAPGGGAAGSPPPARGGGGGAR